ncbi:unnamed protein product, partial [Amoebophrya sp. A25]
AGVDEQGRGGTSIFQGSRHPLNVLLRRSCEEYARMEREWRQWVACLMMTEADMRAEIQKFERDEALKEEICRLCPHCRKLIMRESGCDSMICGQTPHRKKIAASAGCGKSFDWIREGIRYKRTKAPEYGRIAELFGGFQGGGKEEQEKSTFQRGAEQGQQDAPPGSPTDVAHSTSG